MYNYCKRRIVRFLSIRMFKWIPGHSKMPELAALFECSLFLLEHRAFTVPESIYSLVKLPSMHHNFY